ncbi:radical SAM/SPASM domain-containing protein [Thermoanaerobacter sp. RKWS2]|uniref:radical SAM/SPASM domain-containing protein n=1 Tax=Thermoanaerobacter sp. RKWS2 TaxID=2983842 RepID=UPI00224A9936|nr:radical SAM protein [Thermoanaerobacter sp. RKWS2]UZQ81819.1 radical SAM protein [Thermoanaerobacter sp. RKWS2]
MKQKKGRYGNINLEGQKGKPSLILNNREQDFLDEIEDGIKPLVKACIDKYIDTYSSCEGHIYDTGDEHAPQITIVIERKDIEKWDAYIDELKRKHNIYLSPQVFHAVDFAVMNKLYLDPVYYKVYFSNKEKERSISLAAESILKEEFPQYRNPILDDLKAENIEVRYVDNPQIVGNITITSTEPKKWEYFARRVNENGKIIEIEEIEQGVKITFLQQNYHAYKRFYDALLKKFYLVNPKVKHFSVLVKPTHRCNLDCKYCYDKPFRERIKVDMSFETLDRLLKLLSEYTEHVQFIWHGGEPTMVGIQWYIKAYEEIFPKYPMLDFDFHIMSNGTNFNEKWLNLFKQYNIKPGMSFNAMYQEKLRVTSQSKENNPRDVELAKKLEEVLELSQKIGPKLGVIDVITSENYKDMIKIYEFYKQKGITVSMNMVFHTPQTEKYGLELTTEEYEKEYIKYFKYWLYDENGVYERSAVEMLAAVIGATGELTCRNTDCRYKWIGVNPLGEIYPCDRYYPDKYKMGSIFEIESIDEAFQSEGYKTLVREIEERFRTKCAKCGYWFACKGGCNASAVESTGTAAGVEENYCEFFRSAFNDVYDILRNVDVLHDKLNPEARRIMLQNGFYSVKEIYQIIDELKLNIKLEYNKDDLLNCSEYQVFRGINYMKDSVPLYIRHTDIIIGENTKEVIKINEQKRKEDIIKYLVEVAKGAYAGVC